MSLTVSNAQSMRWHPLVHIVAVAYLGMAWRRKVSCTAAHIVQGIMASWKWRIGSSRSRCTNETLSRAHRNETGCSKLHPVFHHERVLLHSFHTHERDVIELII